MPIRVRKCAPIGGGCNVKISQANDEELRYFRDVCSQHGWQIADRGEVPGVARSRSFDIKGASPDDFHAAVKGNSEFDISCLLAGG